MPHLTQTVQTPPEPWSYARRIPIVPPAVLAGQVPVALVVVIDMAVEAGEIGLFLEGADGVQLCKETRLEAGASETVRLSCEAGAAATLIVRNGALPGVSSARFDLAEPALTYRIDTTGHLAAILPDLLREPGTPALAAVARRIYHDVGLIAALSNRDPLPVPIDIEPVLTEPIGEAVLQSLKHMLDLLPTYDPTRMDKEAGYGSAAYVGTYLRASSIRVYHLADMLQEMGLPRGRILDLGSYLGTFALPLRRLGYEVTAIDRYTAFNGGIDGYVDAMREAGVELVYSSVETELDDLARLGQFDAVISMAVVEHIPHTPRLFLENLASHVRPGGILALDTPNHVRYWNRKAMAAGESVHQSIEHQYRSAIPFGGHHREYTMKELVWMMRQIGATDIHSRFFDYNVIQFDMLYRDHLDALLQMAVDATLADTLLVGGRIA
jgi:2-polyprenyl-3-methyl-5-hydroxy-6-metoxy-1,4-benzoquinol methylase